MIQGVKEHSFGRRRWGCELRRPVQNHYTPALCHSRDLRTIRRYDTQQPKPAFADCIDSVEQKRFISE